MKKRHGWVRQAALTRRFVMISNHESEALREAVVFSTRKEARGSALPRKLNTDIVRKVELYKNGKAKMIIPGR